MITILLGDLLTDVRRRKQDLGIVDTEKSIDTARNKGTGSTPKRREPFRRFDERLPVSEDNCRGYQKYFAVEAPIDAERRIQEPATETVT